MKLNSAIVFIASIASPAYASGNLRSMQNVDHAIEEEEVNSNAEAFMHMKDSPDGSRLLERSHETMTTTEQHEEKKRLEPLRNTKRWMPFWMKQRWLFPILPIPN